jgi:hypothetical protein
MARAGCAGDSWGFFGQENDKHLRVDGVWFERAMASRLGGVFFGILDWGRPGIK